MSTREILFRGKTFRIVESDVLPGTPNPSVFTFEDEASIREEFWHITPGELVLDVGAAFGSYTLTALVQGGVVHAFEPHPQIYPVLVENLRLNGWLDVRGFAHQIGMWSGSGYVCEKEYAPHSTRTDLYPMTTLDYYMEKSNHPRVDWIKVDVEGGEVQVLEGGAETIRRFRPKMLVECHQFVDPSLKDRVMALLSSLVPGYEFKPVVYHGVVELYAHVAEA